MSQGSGVCLDASGSENVMAAQQQEGCLRVAADWASVDGGVIRVKITASRYWRVGRMLQVAEMAQRSVL